jgi:TM2 domain-containing membrane protein YozV
MTHNGKFTPQQFSIIQDKLANIPDEKSAIIFGQSYHDATIMLILSIFFGSYGIDRMSLGDIGLGIVKLLTCGGCGIWTIIDWFSIKDKTYEVNFKKFNESLMMI